MFIFNFLSTDDLTNEFKFLNKQTNLAILSSITLILSLWGIEKNIYIILDSQLVMRKIDDGQYIPFTRATVLQSKKG